jgi:ribosomal protein L37AE/L43A
MLVVNNFLRQDSEHLQDSDITIIFALQILETVQKLLDWVSMSNNLNYECRECKTDLFSLSANNEIIVLCAWCMYFLALLGAIPNTNSKTTHQFNRAEKAK